MLILINHLSLLYELYQFYDLILAQPAWIKNYNLIYNESINTKIIREDFSETPLLLKGCAYKKKVFFNILCALVGFIFKNKGFSQYA